MLEDHHRVRVRQGRPEHAVGIFDGGGSYHLDARNVRIPGLQAVRVLGGQLTPGAGRHSDNERDRELPTGHMAKGRSGIDELVQR